MVVVYRPEHNAVNNLRTVLKTKLLVLMPNLNNEKLRLMVVAIVRGFGSVKLEISQRKLAVEEAFLKEQVARQKETEAIYR